MPFVMIFTRLSKEEIDILPGIVEENVARLENQNVSSSSPAPASASGGISKPS